MQLHWLKLQYSKHSLVTWESLHHTFNMYVCIQGGWWDFLFMNKFWLCFYLLGKRWKGLGSIIPACGKKGFIPGGRSPGEVRNGLPANPNGLPKFNAAAADEVGVNDPELETTGEVGTEMGDDDWTILGLWPAAEGDKICGEGVLRWGDSGMWLLVCKASLTWLDIGDKSRIAFCNFLSSDNCLFGLDSDLSELANPCKRIGLETRVLQSFFFGILSEWNCWL